MFYKEKESVWVKVSACESLDLFNQLFFFPPSEVLEESEMIGGITG